MEQLLNFLSNLMILTGGLVAVLFWIVVIIAVSVELYDRVIGDKKKENRDA